MNFHHLPTFLTCCILSLAVGILTAQPANYRHFTIEDGLPSDAVYGAMQDRDGYIWIYTERGVAKFDGYKFKNFGVEDGLPSYDVWGLTEDSKGRLWIHTKSDKLGYIFQDSVYIVKTPKGRSFFVQHFYDDEGKVWFGNAALSEHNISTIEGDSLLEFDHFGVKVFYDSLNSEGKLDHYTYIDSYHYVGFGKDSILYFNKEGDITDRFANSPERMNGFHFDEFSPFMFILIKPHQANSDRAAFLIAKSKIGSWNYDKKLGNNIEYKDILGYQPDGIANAPSYLAEKSLQVTLMPGPGFLEFDEDLNFVDSFFIKGINFRRIFKDREGNFLDNHTGGRGLFPNRPIKERPAFCP